MNPEQNPRQLRLLLAGAAAALVVSLGAFVLLQPAKSSADWSLFLGRFHPLVVHLPIGVMLLVAAAEVASFKSNLRARLDPVITPVLVVLVGTALSAFIAGLLLARGGGYPEALLVPHQRLAALGMILLCSSLAAWSLARWSLARERASARWRQGYRALLAAGVLSLGAGAHYGGSMTHGETYLVRYAPEPIRGWFGVEPPKKTPQVVVPSKDPTVYADVVQPVLSKFCVNCHGPDKTKGDLRLDSYAALMKGGESGPAIVARAPEKSRLVSALALPLADADHMPPEGKPQPTAAQIELISWWILRGAAEHERVREVMPPAAVLELLKTRVGARHSEEPLSPEASGPAPAPSGSAPSEPESGAAPAEPPDASEPSESAAAAAASPVASATRGLVYEDLVAPLLAARCAKCHGSAKQKGKLRVDSLAALEKGGKGGPALVSGDAARSSLVARLRLPLADDEHMPPKDEAQLTSEQIRLLEWWIDAGAEPSVSRDRLPQSLAALRPPAPAPAAPPASAAGAATAATSPETAPSGQGSPRVEAAPAAADEPGAAVVPAPAELLAELPEQIALFPDLILPLLKEDCGDCHLGEPLMGDLSVASFDDLMRADVIVPGEPQNSELLRRVTLPVSDDDRMPPAGQDPLSALEIAALRFWILEGAEPDAIWPRDRLPADVARAVHSRLPARRATQATAPAAGSGPRAEPVTAGGCAACAVGADAGRRDGTAAALGLLVWLGAWKQRTVGRRAFPSPQSAQSARRFFLS